MREPIRSYRAWMRLRRPPPSLCGTCLTGLGLFWPNAWLRNSVAAWQELLMLPKAVLGPPARRVEPGTKPRPQPLPKGGASVAGPASALNCGTTSRTGPAHPAQAPLLLRLGNCALPDLTALFPKNVAVFGGPPLRLFPLQVGVGIKCGAEAAVHTSRQRNEGDKVLLKVNFSNAFNSVQRNAVLRAARRQLPQVVPWVDWCYGRAGTFAFCPIALQPALEAATAAAPLDLCFAYLDDVVLAGRDVHVLRALQALTAAAAPTKCELVQAAGPFSQVDPAAFPAGFVVRDAGNFDLLCAAVGTPQFCTRHTLEDKVAQGQSCLEALVDLAEPQTALLLLRYTASFCKMV
ncbi:unnamed protein product [Symbiodinium sp. CCMP2592]|nr:unnamed protein product [Symbiodinium sp. CCMP2592]